MMNHTRISTGLRKLPLHPLVLFSLLLAPVASHADPVFAPPAANPFGAYGGQKKSSEFVDIDADGDLDWFFGATGTQVFLATNTSTFAASPSFVTAPVALPFVISGQNPRPALTDIDGDGDLDIFVGQHYTSPLLLFRNQGNATAASWVTAPLFNPFGISLTGNGHTPEFVDIDNDGDVDLFAGYEGGDIRFCRNTGSATAPAFAAAVTNPFGMTVLPFANRKSMIAFDDVDRDGDQDAYVAFENDGIFLYRNTGTAAAAAFAPPMLLPFGLQLPGVSVIYGLESADMDRDGDSELLYGLPSSVTYYYFQNSSDLSPPTVLVTPPSAPAAEDRLIVFIRFSENVGNTFTDDDVTLIGSLAGTSTLVSVNPFPADPFFAVLIEPNDPYADGTLGVQINGLVEDLSGNNMTVPVSSALFTVDNYPKGDVNKNGTFDLADVALLADANLSLVTLP